MNPTWTQILFRAALRERLRKNKNEKFLRHELAKGCREWKIAAIEFIKVILLINSPSPF